MATDEQVSYVTKGVFKRRPYCKPCWAIKQRNYKQSAAGIVSRKKSALKPERIEANKRWKKTEKRRKWQKEYQQREHVKQYNREYAARRRIETPEVVKEAYQQWYAKHGTAYHRKWYSENMNGAERIRKMIGQGVRNMLNSFKEDDIYTSSKLAFVGFNSVDELKFYFEDKWEEGMNWENYGRFKDHSGWVIDHIIPQRMYDHDDIEDINRCWHFMNLRPCWDMENSIKGGRMPSPSLLSIVPIQLYPKRGLR
jgi:hypothetical protein